MKFKIFNNFTVNATIARSYFFSKRLSSTEKSFCSSGNARSMGAFVDGIKYQQARTEEQPASGFRCTEVVRCVSHAATAFEIHDLCANAHDTFR